MIISQNALKPREIEVCEQCGLTFEFNRFIFSEVGKYKQHLDSHKTRCKECGIELASPTERKFHQRTHKPGHVKCPHEGCIFVGTEQVRISLLLVV